MTPTATYIASENCLQLLPQVKPPVEPNPEFYGGDSRALSQDTHDFVMKKEAYNAHLATLQKIPCDPSCKGLWADQEKLVEGKDYEVHSICGFYKTDCGKRKHCEDCRLVALPLIPVKRGDLREEIENILYSCRTERGHPLINTELCSKIADEILKVVGARGGEIEQATNLLEACKRDNELIKAEIEKLRAKIVSLEEELALYRLEK